jgi:predicted nucleic acid-binding Zn ribbon protein
MEKLCIVCGTMFNIKKSQFNKKRFCSRVCHDKYFNNKREKVCSVCGKKFYKYTVRFCSPECWKSWRKGKCFGGIKKGTKLPQISKVLKGIRKSKYIKVSCVVCGKSFEVTEYRKRMERGKCCSKKCHGDLDKKRYTDKGNPNWRDGISKEPYGFEFDNNLKMMVRKRDNFTCQQCGYTEEQLGKKLGAHHIDYNKKNNNTNNLISLCKICHGQTNFKREDWINYFQKKTGGI